MTENISSMPSAKLGPQARRFLATMAGRGRRLLRTEEAYEFWPSTDVARQALSRLVRSGWLERIERGLYLIVPLEAGPEGHWTEDPMVIAAQLVPSGAVGYWSAPPSWGVAGGGTGTYSMGTCDNSGQGRFSSVLDTWLRPWMSRYRRRSAG